MAATPTGEERQVKFLGGAAIDGAPVAYIVVLAAVVAALAFIPFSVILASGGSFPMSQGIYGLVGWILGPIAGAVATIVGSLIGLFIAPHTAGVPAIFWTTGLGSFMAGCMVLGAKRKGWWLWVGLFVLVCYFIYIGRALFVNHVSLSAVFFGSIIDWSGILLWFLPTRTLFAKWINGKNLAMTAVGLFLGTWMLAGCLHAFQCMFTYFMFNWPEDVWVMLIPIIPMENLFRSLIGAVIGTGVIAGLRAIGLVKPANALY